MDLKLFFTALLTVFIAELGDKTQFATMALAAGDKASPWTVFIGASMGLIFAAGLGVIAGQLLSGWLTPKLMHALAGLVFLILGGLSVYKALQL